MPTLTLTLTSRQLAGMEFLAIGYPSVNAYLVTLADSGQQQLADVKQRERAAKLATAPQKLLDEIDAL
jgi:hypothetical protein